MDQKTKITKLVLESQGLDVSDKRVRLTIPTWWVSARKKETGGLRLTEQGFDCLTKAGIKSHRVKFEHPIEVNNKLLIYLDRFIDCPWFANNKEIYVFNDKMAIQLVLFEGNVAHFVGIKAKNHQKNA
jgi:hypothetical protein